MSITFSVVEIYSICVFVRLGPSICYCVENVNLTDRKCCQLALIVTRYRMTAGAGTQAALHSAEVGRSRRCSVYNVPEYEKASERGGRVGGWDEKWLICKVPGEFGRGLESALFGRLSMQQRLCRILRTTVDGRNRGSLLLKSSLK